MENCSCLSWVYKTPSWAGWCVSHVRNTLVILKLFTTETLSFNAKRTDGPVLCMFYCGEQSAGFILSQKSDRKQQLQCLHILYSSKYIRVKKAPAVEKSHFASSLGEGHSAWGNSSLHLQAPAPLPQSWNKVVLARRRRNVLFPVFLRWFDFAKEWVRSLAVNLRSYSHHHWPSKAVILFCWEMAVVTNKPWSKCGRLCSHITFQKSTHARDENTDTRDHTTPLPFLGSLLFDLVSGKKFR